MFEMRDADRHAEYSGHTAVWQPSIPDVNLPAFEASSCPPPPSNTLSSSAPPREAATLSHPSSSSGPSSPEESPSRVFRMR
ncbi:hypothetical protein N7535_005005 [Penicillium sp. DV-2018c]|nr:hypothetical protein N7535_005005 [Penicillium sp. DV-2018c]